MKENRREAREEKKTIMNILMGIGRTKVETYCIYITITN